MDDPFRVAEAQAEEEEARAELLRLEDEAEEAAQSFAPGSGFGDPDARHQAEIALWRAQFRVRLASEAVYRAAERTRSAQISRLDAQMRVKAGTLEEQVKRQELEMTARALDLQKQQQSTSEQIVGLTCVLVVTAIIQAFAAVVQAYPAGWQLYRGSLDPTTHAEAHTPNLASEAERVDGLDDEVCRPEE